MIKALISRLTSSASQSVSVNAVRVIGLQKGFVFSGCGGSCWFVLFDDRVVPAWGVAVLAADAAAIATAATVAADQDWLVLLAELSLVAVVGALVVCLGLR